MSGGRWPELAILVAEPWSGVDELLAGLRAIDEWGRRHGDARGSFAAAYVVVTAAVVDALDRGSFTDPEWVVRVVIDFAERYRLAVRAAVNGEPGRPCWGPALRPASGRGAAAIVALLHAMIAHIHHDLAHTLSACRPMHPLRAADYDRLGVVICGSTRTIQRELLVAYAPGLRGAHEVLRGADTWLTNAIVRAWRGRARLVAERMNVSPASAAAWSRRLARESAALAAGLHVLTWRLVAAPRGAAARPGWGAPRSADIHHGGPSDAIR